jgi:hypothetical protein
MHIVRMSLRYVGDNLRFNAECSPSYVSQESFFSDQYVEHCEKFGLSKDSLGKWFTTPGKIELMVVGIDTTKKKQKLMMRNREDEVVYVDPAAMQFYQRVGVAQ